MKILPGAGWAGLIRVLYAEQGTVLLLGATDSGKTTLARYIVDHFAARGLIATLIDSDIGQSSIGLPGTIAMRTFQKPEELGTFGPVTMFFIGGTNPALYIQRIIEGTRTMVRSAKRRGLKMIIVDTSGLVQGEVGKALKIEKILALQPSRIIALQRGRELEHILSHIEGISVSCLHLADNCTSRNRTARRRYREARFREYLGNAGEMVFLRGDVELLDGRRLARPDEQFKRGSVAGIYRGKATCALGLLLSCQDDWITIKTPLRSKNGITRIMVGDIDLSFLL